MTTRSVPTRGRTARLQSSVALLGSGGHTFVIQRQPLVYEDEPLIEQYVITTPHEEGELAILRCGQQNDGSFGVEYYSRAERPLSTERALWWMHALHAAARFAEELNRRAGAMVAS